MVVKRQIVFPFALFLTLLTMVILAWVGNPLTTSAAPNGIISYEFSGNVTNANRILNSWGDEGRLHAAFSLGLDFLYILAYVTTISLACTWAREVLNMREWPISGAGKYLTWGVCLAGALDGIENIGLTVMLLVKVSSPWPQLAAVCAAGKFLLIALALLYVTFGGLAWVTGSKPTN